MGIGPPSETAMPHEPHPDLKSIFGQALELDPARRAAFLDQVCAHSKELRADVEELLRLHDRAGSFLLRTPEVRSEPADTVDRSDEQPGARIGPYKLLQQIGEGGMGTVYMAEQEEPVRRKVALKIIKPGMDSKPVIARFEAERQALALMDHPNIARVFDAGTTNGGRPYFVMELVHGVPFVEFCDAHKLEPRERLELFCSVCQAIHHAHQKGIIHRDIKPGNVLVTMHDDRPVPKVIDFGIAKAVDQRLTDKTLFTQFGALVGTFEYMSPEQAEMNSFGVDTRSDVYSLGVLLYELLTGSTPLDRTRIRQVAFGEIVRLIREEEPQRPSERLSSSGTLDTIAAARRTEPARLPGLVRGELDWIVMRCLEKDRTRRYDGASALARDVRRYLAGDAVEACPPTFGYRFRKACGRHRRSIVTASLLALVVIAGTTAALIAWRAERLRESEATALLNSALDRGSLALGQAISSPINREDPWAAARVDRDRVVELVNSGRIPAEVRTRAEEFLSRFAHAEADRRLAAQVEEVVIISATHDDLASWTRMESQFRGLFRDRGLDLDTLPPDEIARRIQADPSADALIDALELWIATRGQLSAMGGPKATRETMQPWVDAILAADRDPLRQGLRRLIYADRPPKPDQVEDLLRNVRLETASPRTLSWLGTVFFMAGASNRSDDIYHRALRRYPDNFMLNFDYAYMLVGQKRWPEAIRYYLCCLTIRPDVSGIWRGLGVAFRHTGELPRSRDALRRALELQPDNPPILIDLVETLLAQRDFAAAESAARDAVRLAPESAAGYGILGRTQMEKGSLTDALKSLERCLELTAQRPDPRLTPQIWIDECRRRLNATNPPNPPPSKEFLP